MTNKSLHTIDKLVERAKEGDTKAFSDLIILFKDKSYSLACSILKDTTKAEDVLQEAFIKVYKNISGFRSSSKFSTWLYRIVVNTAYNALKGSKNYIEIDEEANNYLPEEAEEQFDNLKLKDQQYYIKSALDAINPDEAVALRLFYLCELKISEIEEITGHGTSKIKVDLHRGRANVLFQLKRLLGNELNDLL